MYRNKKSLIVSIVNYGTEQLDYLQKQIDEINSFKKYDVTIYLTSNIPLEEKIIGVDHYNLITNLKNWNLLPLEARKIIKQNVGKYDLYLYTENDHLWLESHIDNYLKYEGILPKNYIPGLIQYEKDENGGLHYPGYHWVFEWDFNFIEEYNGLKFAHFSNHHQASFLISNDKLVPINEKYDLSVLKHHGYTTKCTVNTEIYKDYGLKKVICISEFDDNLIYHMPNVYINGIKGRNKNQSSGDDRMRKSLSKLLSLKPKNNNIIIN